MPSLYKVFRGVDIKGWKVYHPKEIIEDEEDTNDTFGNGESEELAGKNEEELRREEEKEVLKKEVYRETEEQRRQILEEAEKEASALKDKAFKEGYVEGYNKGEEEASGLKEEAEKVLQEAWQKREEIIEGAEEEIIQLSVNLAEKLMGYRIEVDSEIVIAVLIRCLENMPRTGSIILIRLHPGDVVIAENNLQRLKSFLKKDIELEIAPDENIPRGSCRVESEEAEAEVNLPKELKILAQKLLQLANWTKERDTADILQGDTRDWINGVTS